MAPALVAVTARTRATHLGHRDRTGATVVWQEDGFTSTGRVRLIARLQARGQPGADAREDDQAERHERRPHRRGVSRAEAGDEVEAEGPSPPTWGLGQ